MVIFQAHVKASLVITEGTHVNGHDMDIAYYQLTGDDNHLRAVCEHYQGDKMLTIVLPQSLFDLWRTALFLAKMHDNPRLRVIGVDGKLGVQITTAISQMCSAGWIQSELVPILRSLTKPQITGTAGITFIIIISTSVSRCYGLSRRTVVRMLYLDALK